MQNIQSLEQVPGAINELHRLMADVLSRLSSPAQITPTDEAERLLSRQEAADLLRVSLPTLGELTKSGKLPGYRIPGTNRLRYKACDVNKALTAIKPAA